MEPVKKEDTDIKVMLADYMENGFLDNIIDMFKHDQSLYAYIGDLIADERIRVRLGATALLESLHKEDAGNIMKSVPYILPLLKSQNPVIRGDAAYILGVIGKEDIIPLLKDIIDDEDINVRIIVKEAIEEIRACPKSH